MPFRLVQSGSSAALWQTCADRFLDELGDNRGPSGFESHLWITHRSLRDLLFERAYERGMPGWLGPPVSFFSELPQLFDIRLKPVGVLTRRRLVSRLAANRGREILDREPGNANGVVRGHMLDSLLGDLLPEGVSPDRLRELLTGLDGDEFATKRNEWIVKVYAGYVEELERLGAYDSRSIHALIAERIESGGLKSALHGADRLHIYGIYGLRVRQRMFGALASQPEVDVVAYVAEEPEASEFEALTRDVESAAAGADNVSKATAAVVQPAPDTVRELDWVAREVKQLLVAGEVEPHDIAVVARSGRDDTGRAYRVLSAAGIHCTARIRTPLTEISALKALVSIFGAAASRWSYRRLRSVLDHPYFNTGIDLRAIDYVSQTGRIEGLDEWEERLGKLATQLKDEDKSLRGKGLFADRVEKDLAALQKFRAEMEQLDTPHTEAEWLDITRTLVRDGVFHLRRRVCDAVDDRWDIVRFDQRGLIQLEKLLSEWAGLDHAETIVEVADWYALLRRMLEANELVLSTPMQKGVQILEAHDAALVPFRHTFVIHANDGEFPRRGGAGGVFLDEERMALRDAGLSVSHREDALRRERSLWRAITLGGDVRISYRTTDPAGTPLLPSLMVPQHDPSKEIPRTRAPRRPDGSHAEPINPAQANRLAAHELAEQLQVAAEVVQVEVAPADLSLLDQAIVAAVAEAHRDTGVEVMGKEHPVLGPNPWNGEIRDQAVLDWLAERFNAEYPWSAGQLEQYSTCPFVFFTNRVLRLDDSEEADEQLSPMAFGGIAHDLLERFYREAKENLPAFLEGEALELFERVADEAFGEREARGEWLGLPVLWPVTKRSVRDCVRAYIEWELGYLDKKGEVPHLTEHAFGFDEPCVIRGAGVSSKQVDVRIRGRIDRVDRVGDSEDARHHVLDYKTSTIPRKSGYKDGSVLQGPIYLRVLEESGLAVSKCRYRSIRNPGKPQNGAELGVGHEDFDQALTIAFSIPARVRAGLFEATLAANVGSWPSFYPGREICRSQAQLEDGNRFDA